MKDGSSGPSVSSSCPNGARPADDSILERLSHGKVNHPPERPHESTRSHPLSRFFPALVLSAIEESRQRGVSEPRAPWLRTHSLLRSEGSAVGPGTRRGSPGGSRSGSGGGPGVARRRRHPRAHLRRRVAPRRGLGMGAGGSGSGRLLSRRLGVGRERGRRSRRRDPGASIRRCRGPDRGTVPGQPLDLGESGVRESLRARRRQLRGRLAEHHRLAGARDLRAQLGRGGRAGGRRAPGEHVHDFATGLRRDRRCGTVAPSSSGTASRVREAATARSEGVGSEWGAPRWEPSSS